MVFTAVFPTPTNCNWNDKVIAEWLIANLLIAFRLNCGLVLLCTVIYWVVIKRRADVHMMCSFANWLLVYRWLM